MCPALGVCALSDCRLDPGEPEGEGERERECKSVRHEGKTF